jgi:hypothetical protein
MHNFLQMFDITKKASPRSLTFFVDAFLEYILEEPVHIARHSLDVNKHGHYYSMNFEVEGRAGLYAGHDF